MAISGAQRVAVFGQPGHVNRVVVTTPWGIKVQCHALLAPLFLEACNEAAGHEWKPQRIDSYNPRPIRGQDGNVIDEWSIHSWALAWDFFATPPNVPPPGGVWTPDNPVPAEFAACFTRRGFRWGASFRRKDLPHIEWADGLPTNAPQQEDDDLNEGQDKVLRATSDTTAATQAEVAKIHAELQQVAAWVAILVSKPDVVASSVGALSDADLARIAKAVNDEDARRKAN